VYKMCTNYKDLWIYFIYIYIVKIYLFKTKIVYLDSNPSHPTSTKRSFLTSSGWIRILKLNLSQFNISRTIINKCVLYITTCTINACNIKCGRYKMRQKSSSVKKRQKSVKKHVICVIFSRKRGTFYWNCRSA
jgi:hypothetical protein